MPNQTETYMDRYRERAAQGTDFYPCLHSKPSQRDWEKLFDAREGRIHPSKLPNRMRSLFGKPLTRIMQEGIYHREGPVDLPPTNDPQIIATFCREFAPPTLRARSNSGGMVAARAFSNVIGAWALDGFHEVQDSLADIVEQNELPSFLTAPVLQALDTHHLQPVAKGGTAAHTEINVVDCGEWRIVRLGLKAIVDEQVLIDDVPGSIRKSIGQLGRAAKRSGADLCWATILSNPTLDADGLPVFHADHDNVGVAVLSDTSLAAAMAAIRKQVIYSADGHVNHVNLQPRFLIVTPALEGVARKALRLMKLDDPAIDLTLRVESRLSDLGTVNPITGATVSGSDTNWLLCAGNDVAPWLLQGILIGGQEPRVRIGELDASNNNGQYGLAVDVNWDIACKIADYRGVYFSTGAGA